MARPEIILLGGAPGVGKGEIGKKAVELDRPSGVRHLAIGDLKRDIIAGKTPSAYFDLLQQTEHPDRVTGASPSEAMTGIMEEFILGRPDGLIIVDGFPRYMDRVVPFRQSMERIGASVLALCIVEVDENVSVERLLARESRPGQKIKDPMERMADHENNIVPTLAVLAADLPTYRLDGTIEPEVNVAELVRIYEQHSVAA